MIISLWHLLLTTGKSKSGVAAQTGEQTTLLQIVEENWKSIDVSKQESPTNPQHLFGRQVVGELQYSGGIIHQSKEGEMQEERQSLEEPPLYNPILYYTNKLNSCAKCFTAWYS